jgi:hypothetical protein
MEFAPCSPEELLDLPHFQAVAVHRQASA